MRYTVSDLPLSHNTTYLTLNQDQSDNLRARGLGQSPSVLSRFSNMADLESSFLTSEQHHEGDFATSELLQSRETSYIISDRAQPREAIYTSDGARTNRYLTSGIRQPLETGSGVPDPPQLREMRYMVTDLAPSQNSKYISPSQEQAESPRFRHSGQSPVRVSRFSDMGEHLTETEISQLRESSSILMDRAKRRESKHTSSPLQETRYFASDHRQPLDTSYGAPEPPQISKTRFIVSDQLSPQETRFTASNLTQSRDSRYVTPKQDPSKNSNLRSTDLPPSRDSRFRYQGEPLEKSTALQKVESPFVASAHALEHGFRNLDVSGREAYTVPDVGQRNESRYTSDRSQENRYLSSDHRQSVETGYGVPDPPQISEPRLTGFDQISPQKTKYMATDRTVLYDSRYETPNEDQPKNTRLRGVGQAPTRVSRFSNVEEKLTDTAVLQNFTSKFLASEQPREYGFSATELTRSQEVGYRRSDQAKDRDSRYPLGQTQESKYIASDRRHPHDTSYVAPDPPQLRGTRYKASEQAPSQEPRSAAPKQDQSKNPRSRGSDEPLSYGSRFRGVDKPSVQESQFRGSDRVQSTEGRYMERGPLYPSESGWRMSDPKKFR